jgi:hypothetical protein
MAQLINEAKRFQKLAGIVTESPNMNFDKIALDHSNTAPNTPPGATAGEKPIPTSKNEGMQYFHNGADMNQIINYNDSDITDDLEAFGQGSMDGQDFKPGQTYNIGGQEYKIEPQGDEFKLVLAESIEQAVNEALTKFRKTGK